MVAARIPGILIPECQNKIPLEFQDDKNGKPLFNYKSKKCPFFDPWSYLILRLIRQDLKWNLAFKEIFQKIYLYPQ